LLSSLAVSRPALADDTTLSIIAGAPTPGIFDTLELIAAGAGFYRDEHLTVTKDYASSAGTATQLVANGKADVASVSVEPVLLGYEKGIRLQFFLSRQARYSYALAVLSDSPIRTLADFKGTTLGENNAGSAAEVATRSMLSGVGLRSSDYAFVQTGSGAAGLNAVLTKRVDGLAFPYIELALYQVVGHATFRYFRHPILKDIGNVGYAAAPATIQAKADAMRRFCRAIVKASLFVRVNPAAAARLYLQGSGQRVTADAIASTTQLYRLLQNDFPAADASNPRIGYLSPQALQLYSTYLTQYGMTHAVVPGTTLATDQFIPFANDFDHQALENYARSFPT
jgi:NitT/TauT family transport system substrate-binding protein